MAAKSIRLLLCCPGIQLWRYITARFENRIINVYGTARRVVFKLENPKSLIIMEPKLLTASLTTCLETLKREKNQILGSMIASSS